MFAHRLQTPGGKSFVCTSFEKRVGGRGGGVRANWREVYGVIEVALRRVASDEWRAADVEEVKEVDEVQEGKRRGGVGGLRGSV